MTRWAAGRRWCCCTVARDRTDYRDLVPLLPGCGSSSRPARLRHSTSAGRPVEQYTGRRRRAASRTCSPRSASHAAVVVGYDIESRIAQALARSRPDLVSVLVISPPVPGVGARILGPGPLREFWYQQFHRLPLSEQLIDGNPDAVRAYLRHFWKHWSGPGFTLADPHLDHLVWSTRRPARSRHRSSGTGPAPVPRPPPSPRPPPRRRTGSATPTVILWPEYDPLFPGVVGPDRRVLQPGPAPFRGRRRPLRAA